MRNLITAVILATMMFFSLRQLGFPLGGAAIFSLVPLLLGIVNVFTSVAYGLTGIIFIAACATALIPDWQAKSKEFFEMVNSDLAHEAAKARMSSEKGDGTQR